MNHGVKTNETNRSNEPGDHANMIVLEGLQLEMLNQRDSMTMLFAASGGCCTSCSSCCSCCSTCTSCCCA